MPCDTPFIAVGAVLNFYFVCAFLIFDQYDRGKIGVIDQCRTNSKDKKETAVSVGGLAP
jgi:hypothetical protein